MGTLLSILGASLVIAIAIMAVGAAFVFLMDNQKYKDMIKKITH